MQVPLIRQMGGDCAPPPHQRYSDPPEAHRARAKRRRKYLFTDQIDQLIREIYLSHPGAKTRPGIRMLAKKEGDRPTDVVNEPCCPQHRYPMFISGIDRKRNVIRYACPEPDCSESVSRK